MNDKCPGCHRAFHDGDITGMLPTPFSTDQIERKWHLGCHQAWFNREQLRLWPALWKQSATVSES